MERTEAASRAEIMRSRKRYEREESLLAPGIIFNLNLKFITYRLTKMSSTRAKRTERVTTGEHRWCPLVFSNKLIQQRSNHVSDHGDHWRFRERSGPPYYLSKMLMKILLVVVFGEPDVGGDFMRTRDRRLCMRWKWLYVSPFSLSKTLCLYPTPQINNTTPI